MEFNADGSLKIKKKIVRDHITLFLHLSELSFPLGKKLFIKSLRGEINDRTKKLGLNKKIYFGSLGGYSEDELGVFIEFLLSLGFIEIEKQKGIYQVLVLSKKGRVELENREENYTVDEVVNQQKTSVVHQLFTPDYKIAEITQEDREVFKALDFFLGKFTDEQKKAIICTDSKQLCVAGAGSGKTAVLTNKIVYLVKFKGVDPSTILAITFTRKAKQELQERLEGLLPGVDIRIETFNSFAEKELLKHGNSFYGRQKRMASFQEFNKLVSRGLSSIGFTMDKFLDHYFTFREKQGKEPRQLFFSFLYDFRAILDSYIQHKGDEKYFEERLALAKISQKITAQNILKLAQFVHEALEEEGLRTFSDQLIDVNELYEVSPELTPKYSWVLIDEYQDVSKEQTKLLELLMPENLFAVGDPRQSIYSWRGANPNTIYDFVDKETTVVELTTNFRSSKKVVEFANAIIAQTNKGKNSFTPLVAFSQSEGLVQVTKYSRDDDEAKAVIERIKSLATPLNEVFILCRTNKALDRYEKLCLDEKIGFIIRKDEKKDLNRLPHENELTLSTVHGIKGLEAEFVFVVGTNFNNYPCKTKDHQYVELLASKDEYDQFEEERRLLYVACTRAKKELYVSYTIGLSPFVNRTVLNKVSESDQTVIANRTKLVDYGTEKIPVGLEQIERQRAALKRWRYLEAQERGLPAYMIFSDKALESLLELQPLTVDELLSVNGLGKTKVKEFGEDILRVMF